MANAVSHGFGAVLILVGSPLLLSSAFVRGGAFALACASVFALAVLVLYVSSTCYHALRHEKAKSVFQVADHCAIYLLIASTYTPFALGPLRGPTGWTLCAAVWVLGIVGIGMEVFSIARPRKASVVLYLAMGWAVLFALGPLLKSVPTPGIALLAAGGVSYTLGVVFYAMKHVRYAHAVWHLCVLAGTITHFFAVLKYGV